MYSKIPKQRLALSKKTKKWREECVDAFIDLSTTGLSWRKDWLKSLYDYYNGVIDQEEYKYVLKPYGRTRKNFPSKLRNYPIIKPIIDLMLGEKSKRPLNYTVTVQNSDTVTEKEKAKQKSVFMNLQQQFAYIMAQTGTLETEAPQTEPQLPEQLLELFEANYVDRRATIGQNSISYIMQQQEIYDKWQKAWFHFLVSGEVYTHRGVRGNETFYDILNPIDIDYDKDPDVEFVEDGDWALIRKDR